MSGDDPTQTATSTRWEEAQLRVATSDVFVDGLSGLVRAGQKYYVDGSGRVLVGWHGSVDPPCGMDGESLVDERALAAAAAAAADRAAVAKGLSSPAAPLDGLSSYYLNRAAAGVIAERGLKQLELFVPLLPCWVSHHDIVLALGLGVSSLGAVEETHGVPYAWATEFENAHTFWRYTEPGFVFRGHKWACSEALYQCQKAGAPGSAEFENAAPRFAGMSPTEAHEAGSSLPLRAGWMTGARDTAMKTALLAKFATAEPGGDELRELLRSTHPRPLVAVRTSDAYWATGPDPKAGYNRLGKLMLEVRCMLVAGTLAQPT